jgi:hypothetical protein
MTETSRRFPLHDPESGNVVGSCDAAEAKRAIYTKVEFSALVMGLQSWADELKAQDPAPLDKIDLLQHAAAVLLTTEELFGPVEA